MDLIIIIAFTILALALSIPALRALHNLSSYDLGKLDGYERSRATYLKYRESPLRWNISVRLRIYFGFFLGALVMSIGPYNVILYPVFVMSLIIGLVLALWPRSPPSIY